VGFGNVLFIAILYKGAILLWALGADDVTLPAFLRIPQEQYYFYELIFLIPIFLLTWVLASSLTVHNTRGRTKFKSPVVGLLAFVGSSAIWVTFVR
jgi:hypothetical protein